MAEFQFLETSRYYYLFAIESAQFSYYFLRVILYVNRVNKHHLASLVVIEKKDGSRKRAANLPNFKMSIDHQFLAVILFR